MLELRPICEHCSKTLPNHTKHAMICSFECTFCRDCVVTILKNVCPNCGGGFENRPSRPTLCITKYCVKNFPPVAEQKHRPIDSDRLKALQETYLWKEPSKR